jgi:hypothetical protein
MKRLNETEFVLTSEEMSYIYDALPDSLYQRWERYDRYTDKSDSDKVGAGMKRMDADLYYMVERIDTLLWGDAG